MGRPKRRRLGQNFLVDTNIAARIVRLLEPEPARVLEIGPGRGALTAPLLERFDRVLALELDEPLVEPLRRRFAGTALEVRHADALREPLEPLLAGEAPWQVAANLPYSVGTAILRRLLRCHQLVTRVVVMLQREVAERVVATPGGKGHGLLALERAARASARIAFHVPPQAFRPRPRVTSSVVVLHLERPQHPAADLEPALELAARALTRPRKMMVNALSGGVTRQDLEAAGIDPAARPGTLELDRWVALARQLR